MGFSATADRMVSRHAHRVNDNTRIVAGVSLIRRQSWLSLRLKSVYFGAFWHGVDRPSSS